MYAGAYKASIDNKMYPRQHSQGALHYVNYFGSSSPSVRYSRSTYFGIIHRSPFPKHEYFDRIEPSSNLVGSILQWSGECRGLTSAMSYRAKHQEHCTNGMRYHLLFVHDVVGKTL
jgi:hypothetical protein